MLHLLKNSCCDELLLFVSNDDIRSRYNKDSYPQEHLEYLPPTSRINLEDIELSPAPEDDAASSITLFKKLKDIDRVQANDRRLWVGLTHGIFFDYTKNRWKISNDTSDKVILRRFHFEGSSLEARMRNSISRLWWAAKITYDESLEDPYELTKVLWSKQDLIQNIVERSYGTYANVVKSLLEIVRENPQLSEKELRFLYTGLNSIGGVKLLPNLTREQIKTEIQEVSQYKGIKIKT